MALNDIYRCTFEFSSPTADGNMVWVNHFRTTEVNSVISDLNEAVEIATENVGVVGSLYLQEITSNITFLGCTVVGITKPTVTTQVAVSNPGTAIGESVSMRDAPVIKLGTGLRGRSYNGRIYLMPPPESVNDGGTILASHCTDLETFVNGLKRVSTQPSGNKYDMVVYSRTLSVPPTSYVSTVVTTVSCNPKTGTQKRRMAVS